MGLEDITKKILAGAEKEAQAILMQARQEVEQLQKEAKARARDLTQEIIQAREAQARQEAIRILSLARLEASKAILLLKQKLLNQIFFHRHVLKLVKINKELILPNRKKQERLDPKVYLKLLRRGCEAKVAEILFK